METGQLPIDYNFLPENEKFPLNIDISGRTVEKEVLKDITVSENYLIITGFTSLSKIVETFGEKEFHTLKKTRIVLGYEPNLWGRKKYDTITLDKEIKEYWLKQGFSIILGGAIMKVIDDIQNKKIEFRYKEKLHAKIYIGDTHAIMGSSNFSKSGLSLQDETNIRVANDENEKTEKHQYDSLKRIAESFFEAAQPYDKIIELLTSLIQKVTWQEALARAIAEVIEGDWLQEYEELYQKLNTTKLWPTQWKGIAQAMTILHQQSNVLIADPTGAGKTKFCSSLIVAIINWLWENGKRNRTSSLIICPPLVIPNWKNEFRDLSYINHNQISMGILSNGKERTRNETIKDISIANIITIDEAHNYINLSSNRSQALKSKKADHTILVTATPINKKAEDLLRLVQLLDVDNLSDEDFKLYKQLWEKPRRVLEQEELSKLRSFISQFTVRRTKKELNKQVEKEPHLYLNREGNTCKFPVQNPETHKTCETKEDLIIASQITNLAQTLRGINYLREINKPDYEIKSEEEAIEYINKRLNAAKALAGYMIRAALRSSHVALVEHIEGSDAATKYFAFKNKHKKTGNIIATLEKHKSTIPKIGFPESLFKNLQWLRNSELYTKACEEDILTYQKISELAKKLSGEREKGKVKFLEQLQKRHKLLIAFDSTIITLEYFNHLFTQNSSSSKVYTVTSDDTKGSAKDEVLEKFALGSKAENCIALCSDKMAEGVNLQQASAIVLLDMPSVLRIAEQRIGRIDRMDSPHKEIEVFWPDDSDEFSLKGDKRLVDTSVLTENLYGSNLNLPKVLKEKNFHQTNTITEIIKEYKDYIEKDSEWEGIHNSLQPVQLLKEGSEPLIPESTYEQIKDIRATIKTRVSFVESEGDWCFICLRGNKHNSPRWYFIAPDQSISTEYGKVCSDLRKYLSGKIKETNWDQGKLEYFISLMRKKDKDLLPAKRKRVLELAEKYIIAKLKYEENKDRRTLLEKNKKLLISTPLGYMVDYYKFSELWIDVFQPFLDKKRESNKREKKVFNLDSLKKDFSKIEITNEQLLFISENCPYTEDIDTKIAACIIGVSEK